jgi:hypothetical protein
VIFAAQPQKSQKRYLLSYCIAHMLVSLPLLPLQKKSLADFRGTILSASALICVRQCSFSLRRGENVRRAVDNARISYNISAWSRAACVAAFLIAIAWLCCMNLEYHDGRIGNA